MMPKLMAAILTALLNLAVGFIVFFVMLLAMNGFSESDANYGIVAYIILAVAATILMVASAVTAVHLLMKRGWGAVGSVILGVVIFSGLGAGLKVVFSLIGVFVADFVRVHF